MRIFESPFGLIVFAGLFTGVLAAPDPARACGDPKNQIIGTACTVSFSWCPVGYAQANGQILPINEYPELFSLFDCDFGGDCRSTFALPDLRGRFIVHQGQGPGLSNAVFAAVQGAEAIEPSTRTMARHTHSATFAPAGQDGVEIQVSVDHGTDVHPIDGSYFAAAYDSSRFAAFPQWKHTLSSPFSLGGVQFTPGSGIVTVKDEGGGKDVPILNPATILTTCIATDGQYPQRN